MDRSLLWTDLIVSDRVSLDTNCHRVCLFDYLDPKLTERIVGWRFVVKLESGFLELPRSTLR